MAFSFLTTEYDASDDGHFGIFGGAYVPEVLRAPLDELQDAYEEAKKDPLFLAELHDLFTSFVGRPTPLYFCKNLTEEIGGAKIFLKNEGLAHTGAHKINHCIGQAILAKRMGKSHIVAETGAGQHGLATASVAARFGLKCTVYMGEVDYERQRPNVFWMEQLGATVIPVTSGTRRLKDAAIAAMQHWTKHFDDTYFLLGSVIGPHPFPSIVKDFQSVIGQEVSEQLPEEYDISHPDYCVACVGGGSNALGLFTAFLDDERVNLIGVEAGGQDLAKRGKHAAKIGGGAEVGIVEGYKSFFLQNEEGQISPTHSISAGVDYSGIGPQHAHLHESGRVQYVSASDDEVIGAFRRLARTEGVISALESAHAVAYGLELAGELTPDKSIVINLSGRGDKDLFITAKECDAEQWDAYLRSQITETS